MFRLPPHRRFPGYPEPGEVLVDRRLEFRPAPGRVDVLDPQQEPAAGPAREVEIQQRRIGVAKMEVAVRARRESENGWRHHTGLVMPGLVPGIHVFGASYRVCQVDPGECTTAAHVFYIRGCRAIEGRRGWPGIGERKRRRPSDGYA